MVEHINRQFGKCSSCGFDLPFEEKIECSNCGKFNYNISDPFVNKKLSSNPDWCLTFCSYLEWSLKFEELDNEQVKYFWCDGIEEFPTQNIIDRGAVTTKAWIGNDGQGIFKMKIIFGPKSISNFKKSLSLIDCIPNENADKWIDIEPGRKAVTVYLK